MTCQIAIYINAILQVVFMYRGKIEVFPIFLALHNYYLGGIFFECTKSSFEWHFKKLGKNPIFLFLNDKKQTLSLNLSWDSNRTVCTMKNASIKCGQRKFGRLCQTTYVIQQCRILSNLKNILYGDIINKNSNRPDNFVTLEAKCEQNKTEQVT